MKWRSSRLRSLALTLALTSGLVTVPGTAFAAPGDSSASGIRTNLDITLPGEATVTVDAVRGEVTAPPSGATSLVGTGADVRTTLGPLGVFTVVDTDVITTSATSTAGDSSANAQVATTRIQIPGFTGANALVAADALEASVDCPPGGPATADVTPPTTLTVAGIPVVLDAQGRAVVTLPGGAGTVSLAVDDTTTTTLTAAATALAADIDVNVPGTVVATGTVVLAEAACEAPPVPVAVSLSPPFGPTGGGTEVTVTGSDFVAGQTTVTIGGIVIPAAQVTVGAGGTTATFTTPAHAAGAVDVVISTPGGSTGPLDFTYLAAPTAASLAPERGSTAGGTEVTVTGTGFVAGQTSVTIGGIVIPATQVTVGAGGTTATFTTPAHAAGAVDVVVRTPGGSTGPLEFTYVPPPTAASLTPPSGPSTGGTEVTITGTGFVAGQTTVTIGGATVAAADVTVGAGGTSLTFTTPAGTPGTVDVIVTTPNGDTAPLEFTYQAVAPRVTGLSPDAGPVTGGQEVTIVGRDFVPGQTTVTIGGIVIPASQIGVGAGGTTLTFTTPAHAAGAVDVVVTTPGGSSAPIDYGYFDAPVTRSISPSVGPVAGGTLVTIGGEGFVPGRTTVTVGDVVIPAEDVQVSDDGRQLRFIAPVHEAGVVGVVVTTPGGDGEPLLFRYLGTNDGGGGGGDGDDNGRDDDGGSLPRTGADAGVLGSLGFGMVLLGALLIAASRRGRSPGVAL